MAFDSSLDIFAAAALFIAAIGAWLLAAPLGLRARLYLRFAAMLFSALGLSVPLAMADMATLLLLPLASAALLISALAHFGRALPVLPASIALVIGLGAGLSALISGYAMLAVAPVMIASLVVVATGLNSIAVMPVLAGGSLLASGLAFMEQGARAGLLFFCAAALVGLAKPSDLKIARSNSPAKPA
jgi:hypothetical protein